MSSVRSAPSPRTATPVPAVRDLSASLRRTFGRDWATARGKSSLEWERAKHATRDAWHRVSDAVERATPGDSDRDGK